MYKPVYSEDGTLVCLIDIPDNIDFDEQRLCTEWSEAMKTVRDRTVKLRGIRSQWDEANVEVLGNVRKDFASLCNHYGFGDAEEMAGYYIDFMFASSMPDSLPTSDRIFMDRLRSLGIDVLDLDDRDGYELREI